MSLLSMMIVRQVAAEVGLDVSALREDESGSVWLDDFVITNDGDGLSVCRETQIQGGADLVQVCPDIPTSQLGYGTRAAVALLRAWVNQSLDYAELAATQPEE